MVRREEGFLPPPLTSFSSSTPAWPGVPLHWLPATSTGRSRDHGSACRGHEESLPFSYVVEWLARGEQGHLVPSASKHIPGISQKC